MQKTFTLLGNITTALLLMLATAAQAASAATTMPVYFIHGFDASPSLGYNCNSLNGVWNTFTSYMQFGGIWNATSWTAGLSSQNRHTVGYYTGDANCDDYLGVHSNGTDTAGVATNLTAIDTIAKRLANLIYSQSNSGTMPVSVVAHSMGGLVIRRAIDGVNDGASGYPKRLNVVSVITLSTPHGGYTGCTIGSGATYNQQCADMEPNSVFFRKLLGSNGSNPQTTYGTAWTLMGSLNDEDVTAASATAMHDVPTRIIYYGTSAPTHEDWLSDNDGAPLGPATTRYADIYSAYALMPFQTGVYDHWMEVTTAQILNSF